MNKLFVVDRSSLEIKTVRGLTVRELSFLFMAIKMDEGAGAGLGIRDSIWRIISLIKIIPFPIPITYYLLW